MFRTWFALGTVVLLAGVAIAQEANPPVAPKPAPRATPRRSSAPDAVGANPAADDQVEYMIEMKILEGKGIFFSDDSVWLDLTAGNSTGELLLKSAYMSLGKPTTAGAAPDAVAPQATLRIGDRDLSNAIPAPASAMPAATGPMANGPAMSDVRLSRRNC